MVFVQVFHICTVERFVEALPQGQQRRIENGIHNAICHQSGKNAIDREERQVPRVAELMEADGAEHLLERRLHIFPLALRRDEYEIEQTFRPGHRYQLV